MTSLPSESASETHPWRLLLCDDSAVERLALGHLLRRSGYEVDEADDGESAILHLQHRTVDLILLDLHMPGNMDGFKVLNYLRQHRPGLPVILMSGMQPDDIQEKMHGLTKHELPPLVIKPFDADQMLNLVEMQLAGEIEN
jgi:CheY-like chemotaxis protein